MTKRKYKEERKKILEKYGRPMSEIPDKYLKDENGLVEGFSRLQKIESDWGIV